MTCKGSNKIKRKGNLATVCTWNRSAENKGRTENIGDQDLIPSGHVDSEKK